MTARIGVAGCGAWGANVVRDLRSLGTAVLVADPDPERRKLARAEGAEGAVPHVDDLPECDGYVVVTPATSHRATCEALLERGAPVYVEKPPCTAIADTEALVARSEGRLFVMHKWRYHPGVLAIGRLLAGGDLGAPVELTTIRTGPQPLPPDVDVTWHLGVHDLAIALELLGAVACVRSANGTLGRGGRIERATSTLSTESGVDHHLVVASGHPAYVREIRLVGTERTAVLPSPNATAVSVVARDGTDHAVAVSDELPLERELAAFLAHCAGGPAPKSTATDALAICEQLAGIDALVRSRR